MPFIFVNYEGGLAGPFTDELRSSRTTVDVRRIMFGFDLKVTYDFYGPDYLYEHIWRFQDDGQFGSTVVIHGPGEEIDGRHTYHLPFRYDLDISGQSGDSFQRRLTAGGWADVDFEGRHLPFSHAGREYHWRVIDKSRNKSASIRARAGDNAELWALRYKQLECSGSWGAVTPSVPGSPGSVPAVYDNSQTVQDTDLVIWYIAHISSIDRVSACGPWFRLEGYRPPEPRDDDDGHHHDHILIMITIMITITITDGR